MQINEIKDLMAQFDQSSLREFSFTNHDVELKLSKNEHAEFVNATPLAQSVVSEPVAVPPVAPASSEVEQAPVAVVPAAEGDVVESPLVGVVYLAPSPDKPAFISVGDRVKKGQTLLIIEAMKVMNEVPAPRDGVVTEILVANEEVADFGKGLVRLK